MRKRSGTKSNSNERGLERSEQEIIDLISENTSAVDTSGLTLSNLPVGSGIPATSITSAKLVEARLPTSTAIEKTSNDFQGESNNVTTNKFNTIEVDTIKTLSNGIYKDNIPRLDNTTNDFKSGQSQNNTSKFDVVEADTIIVTKGNQSRTITSNVSNPDAGLDAAALVSGDLPIARIPDSGLPIKKLDYGCFNEFRIATELGPSFIDSNGYETIKMQTENFRFAVVMSDPHVLIDFTSTTTDGLVPFEANLTTGTAHTNPTTAFLSSSGAFYHSNTDIGGTPHTNAAIFNFDYHAGHTSYMGGHINSNSNTVTVTRGYVYTGAPTTLNPLPRTGWLGNPFPQNVRNIGDTTRSLWEVGVSSAEDSRIKINDESIFIKADKIGTRAHLGMEFKYKIFCNIGKYIYVETLTINPHQDGTVNQTWGYVNLVFRCIGVIS